MQVGYRQKKKNIEILVKNASVPTSPSELASERPSQIEAIVYLRQGEGLLSSPLLDFMIKNIKNIHSGNCRCFLTSGSPLRSSFQDSRKECFAPQNKKAPSLACLPAAHARLGPLSVLAPRLKNRLVPA